jgi:iron complex outermembrane receptor protein
MKLQAAFRPFGVCLFFTLSGLFVNAQQIQDTVHPLVFKSLDSVEVSTYRNKSYIRPYSSTGTKTATPVTEIPQTISSVPRQLMDDKMELNLKEAVSDLAGVNTYSGYDEYTIRGFRAENARNINGLRGYNTTYTSALLLNVESIDVIKGPAAALYGNSDPGGNIDLVTKKPLTTPGGELAVFGGSWNHFRATGDVTGPLNQSKTLLYRLNAGYDQSDGFRNRGFSKSYQIAPSFSFVPNDRIRFNVDFSLSHVNSVLDRGQPGLDNNPDLKATPTRLSLVQPGDYLKETDLASMASVDVKINDHISFHSGYLNYITQQRVAEHGFNDYITDDSVDLYFQTWKFHTVTHTLSNYFDFKFHTGALQHALLVGYDYVQSKITLDQTHYELPDQFGEGSGIVGTFSLSHPVYAPRPVNTYEPADDIDEGGLDADQYHTQGVYLQDQISYKKFRLLLGLRREFYRAPADDDDSAAAPTVENVWLPRIGLVYNILPTLNAYAVYSKGFDPYEASTAVQVFNAPFKPIQSELIEMGLKAGFLNNKLYATLSVYQLSLYNVGVNANDPSNPDLYTQQGEDQARGAEVEVNGNILPNLSFHFAYAYNVAEVKKSEVHGDIGKLKENAPRNSGSSFIKYRFDKGPLKKLSLMGGYNQIGKRNTLDDQVQLPGYITFQAGAIYTLNRFSLAVNWNNISNKTYWSGGYNNIYKWPGAPSNVLFKINWLFGQHEQ